MAARLRGPFFWDVCPRLIRRPGRGGGAVLAQAGGCAGDAGGGAVGGKNIGAVQAVFVNNVVISRECNESA